LRVVKGKCEGISERKKDVRGDGGEDSGRVCIWVKVKEAAV
jgi:hypothetical protein